MPEFKESLIDHLLRDNGSDGIFLPELHLCHYLHLPGELVHLFIHQLPVELDLLPALISFSWDQVMRLSLTAGIREILRVYIVPGVVKRALILRGGDPYGHQVTRGSLACCRDPVRL